MNALRLSSSSPQLFVSSLRLSHFLFCSFIYCNSLESETDQVESVLLTPSNLNLLKVNSHLFSPTIRSLSLTRSLSFPAGKSFLLLNLLFFFSPLQIVFLNAGDHQLVNLLDSLLKIVISSVKINRQLGSINKETGFVAVLKNKLHHPNPHARVNLLRTLNSLCSKYSDPQHFLKHNNLLKVVKFMAEQGIYLVLLLLL